MAQGPAHSTPTQNPYSYKSFSSLVKELLEQKKWTAANLANASNLSATTISRILRNNNDKGMTYRPTVEIVYAIAIGLRVGPDGLDSLLDAAYPERKVWHHVIGQKGSIDDANIMLFDAGLPLLGKNYE